MLLIVNGIDHWGRIQGEGNPFGDHDGLEGGPEKSKSEQEIEGSIRLAHWP